MTAAHYEQQAHIEERLDQVIALCEGCPDITDEQIEMMLGDCSGLVN